MKKALVMLLAVLLSVCVIGGVASAEKNYQIGWNGHTYVSSISVLPQWCPDHREWMKWKQDDVDEIITVNGVKYHATEYDGICAACPDYDDDDIDCDCKHEEHEYEAYILGDPVHKHSLVKHEAVAATCTADGNVEYWYCSGCRKYFSDSEGKQETTLDKVTIGKLGHDWGEWEETKAATCMEKGEKQRVCSRDKSHVEIKETDINPDAHDWDDGVVTTEPTCEAAGLKTYTCQNKCGKTKTEPIDALRHDLKKVDAVAATCTTTGVKEHYECTRCNKLFWDKEGKQATTLGEVTIGAQGHDFVLKYPHVNYLKAAATCTTPAEYYKSCSRCGASSKGETGVYFEHGNPLGHDLGGWVYDDYTHWKKCSRCDYTEQKAAHTYGAGVVTKMPTCWSKGMVRYDCTECDHSYTEELPALGHYFETVTIESTCTGEGYTAQKCIRCGLIVSQGVLDPKGHKPGDWEVTKAATCTEKGQEVKTCTVCGVVVEMREIDALGHDWGEWETVKEPTTEAEGEEKRVCKRDATHVETRPIAKLEPTPTPAPTETPVPTEEPTAEPTDEPTAEPTVEPTAEPTAEPTEPGDSGNTDIPKTGDNSRTGYVYLMMALAAAGLCALAVTRRKESDN